MRARCIFAMPWCRIATNRSPKGAHVSRESPPTRRTVALLDAVVRRPGHDHSLAELAKETGISKATALGILNELQSTGWLTRDPANKTYRPGAAMLAAGTAADEGFAAGHT